MAKRKIATVDTELQQGKLQSSSPQLETETVGNDERVSRSTVFTFRLLREELAAMEQAASEAGLSVSEYVRKAAATRQGMNVLTKPQVNISISTPYSQFGSLLTWNETDVNVTEYQQTTSTNQSPYPL
jgi:hypothetical protein